MRNLRLLEGTGTAANVELNGTEGPLMALNGHTEGREQPLGGIEVHDNALVGLHILTTGGEWLGVQPEIHDDFFGRGSHPGSHNPGNQRPIVSGLVAANKFIEQTGYTKPQRDWL